MKKTDARVKYTNMVIRNSFIKLLKTTPLNKITVKDICELSEINRATFYKHYTDPYDLLAQIENKMLSELKELVVQSYGKSITHTFETILEKMKNNIDLYATIMSENGDNKLNIKIIDLCYEMLVAAPLIIFAKISKPQQEWFFYFLANGCCGILDRWINGGMQESISETAKFINKLLTSLIKQFE